MVNDHNDQLLSETIRFLRFPLIVGVVLIHSQILGEWMERVSSVPEVDFQVYSTVSYILSSIIARVSVPLFFFFSGFLFFYRSSFNAQTYLQKLRKRGRTLLVPYLLWNLIAIVLTFALHFFLSDMVTEGPDSNYSLLDYLQSFWEFKPFHHGTPINDPLWFMRDLMVVMLASPLVYFLLKYGKRYGLAFLGVLWMFGWWIKLPGFSIAALFFYSAGAYFSIHRINFVERFAPYLSWATGVYLFSAILQFYFRHTTAASYLSNINILSGIVLAISLTSLFLAKGKWRVKSFLSEVSFFIYVYHGLIVYRLTSRAFMMLPHADIILLLIYLTCPIIICGIGIPLYYVLNRFFPKKMALLMGDR